MGVYALSYYDKWLDSGENDYFVSYYDLINKRFSSDAYFDNFIHIADWYAENIILKNRNGIEYGVWEYDFPWKDGVYDLERGWVSGMAQGLALQVLAKAWIISKDEKYKQTAEYALNAFLVPVKQGGVSYFDSKDSFWYEEYASINSKETRVLNGHIHALLGLHDAYLVFKNPLMAQLFDKGLSSLILNLNTYAYLKDNRVWTYYDSKGTLANRKYHNINKNLLRKIYAITGNLKIKEFLKAQSGFDLSFFEREVVMRRLKSQRAFLTIGISLILPIFIWLALNRFSKRHK